MKNGKWRVLARRKCISGTIIYESIQSHDDPDKENRRFSATIRGWRNFRLWEGPAMGAADAHERVVKKVLEIRDRIDAGDDSVLKGVGHDWECWYVSR